MENGKIKSVAFTGHRFLQDDIHAEKIQTAVETLIQNGAELFYNGGAMGFDLLSAEAVLSLKEKYPFIKLIVCIPCDKQDKYYSDEDKERYKAVLAGADEIISVSQTYFRGCMQKRDRFMADKADVLVAYCKKETGGTAYTVHYFEKKYPERTIIFL